MTDQEFNEKQFDEKDKKIQELEEKLEIAQAVIDEIALGGTV